MRAYRLLVSPADEEAATVALWEAGTCGFEVRPAAGGRQELLAYFPDDVDPGPVLEQALPGIPGEPASVPDDDWVARFREGFRAFDAGRFRIAPVWDAPPPGPEVLLVDPGRAFGTGTHETTRLCLEAVADLSARRPLGRTLDLGAGTGLLAIAAARLGAGPVAASDVDPEATAASRAHAELNDTPILVVRADGGRGLREAAFDLVLANLMALFLVDRAGEVRRLVAGGGALVLSGLLRADLPEVRAAYDPLCGRARERTLGEWAALVYELPL
jgi:ribosomal protein L11 methyltransferase